MHQHHHHVVSNIVMPHLQRELVRLGSWLCENAKTLNRDRRTYSSKTILVTQRASEFNLEIELKISFFVAFRFLSFHTARVIFRLGRAKLRGPLYPQEQTSPAGPVRSEKCQQRSLNRLNCAGEVNVDERCVRLSNCGFPKSDFKSLAMAKKVKSLAYNHKN